MSKFRKLAAVGLATTLLAACGSGGGGDADAGSKVSEDGVTTLEVWVFQELHGKVYETMAGKWNDENPDKQVDLNIITYPYEDMHSKLQLAANSGKGMPDAVDIEVGKFAAFVRGENPPLMNLNDYVDPYRDDVVEARLDLYSRDGVNYGFPTHVGTVVAFYNEEAMEEAGVDYTDIVTWDDYKEAGVKYHEATGKQFGVANTIAAFLEQAVTAQLGGQFFTDDGLGEVDLDNPIVTQMFEDRVDMLDAGAIGIVPGGEPDAEEAFGSINDGDFAAVVYPQWYASRYVDYMPDLKGKIAIAPAPVYEDAVVDTIGGGGTGLAIAATSPVKDLAAEFFAYAKLSMDGNIAVWEDLGFDPVNMSVWENEEITHNPDNQFNEYFTTNMFDVLNSIETIGHFESLSNPNYPTMDAAFRTTILNDIYDARVPVEEALKNATDQLKNELGE